MDNVLIWYLMLECLFGLEVEIKHLAAKGKLGSLEHFSNEEWEDMKMINRILKQFKEARMLLEAEKQVTASWVSHEIGHIRTELQKIKDFHYHPDLQEMARAMPKNLNK